MLIINYMYKEHFFSENLFQLSVELQDSDPKHMLTNSHTKK